MQAASHKLDTASLVFSAVCLVHCLALPVLVTLMPIVGVTAIDHGLFHQLMLIVVLPTSLLAFSIGCRQHRQGSVAWLGAAGLLLLVIAAFAVDSLWGAAAERQLTIIGGLVLALAHIQNFRHCRSNRCRGHHA